MGFCRAFGRAASAAITASALSPCSAIFAAVRIVPEVFLGMKGLRPSLANEDRMATTLSDSAAPMFRRQDAGSPQPETSVPVRSPSPPQCGVRPKKPASLNQPRCSCHFFRISWYSGISDQRTDPVGLTTCSRHPANLDHPVKKSGFNGRSGNRLGGWDELTMI